MSRLRLLVAFLFLAFLWGASYPAIRASLPGFAPVFLAAARFDLTGLLVLGYGALRRNRWKPGRGDLAGIVTVGVLFVGIHNGLMFLGQARVSSAVASAIIATVPVLSTGFARALLPSDAISPSGFVGILLGLAGVVVIADPSAASLQSSSTIGVLLVFASAVVVAAASVLVRRTRTDLPVTALQGWGMLIGGVCLHVFSLLLGEPQTATFTPQVTAGFVFLVVFAGAMGYLLYFGLLDRLGPVEINLVAYVETGFAALVGWLALGEQVDPNTVLGLCVVFVGFLLVKRDAIRAELVRRGWA